MVDVVALVILS